VALDWDPAFPRGNQRTQRRSQRSENDETDRENLTGVRSNDPVVVLCPSTRSQDSRQYSHTRADERSLPLPASAFADLQLLDGIAADRNMVLRRIDRQDGRIDGDHVTNERFW
jgi:hypothetical protein